MGNRSAFACRTLRSTSTVDLLPGSTVGCFTDGLVERRGESIDVGLERLRASFGAGEPEQVCNAVMSELIGSSHVYDDTALLVFRRVG